MVLNIYEKALALLRAGKCAVLMVVLSSRGSSPGRRGFHMLVSENELLGTVGGGIMEFKLSERARSLMKSGRFRPFIKRQVHDADAGSERSGMICSGEQLIAFYYLDISDLRMIEKIAADPDSLVVFTENGIDIATVNDNTAEDFTDAGLNSWKYSHFQKPVSKVFVFGSGHVGLALCEILSKLYFQIHLFDDRPELNTLERNCFADHKKVIKYEDSAEYVEEGNNSYVVIMSFGYRSDSVILRSLYGKRFRYIGMMGAKEKIKILREQFLSEGFDEDYLEKLHAPIGINIKSETSYEIAVSIAAELIAAKNMHV